MARISRGLFKPRLPGNLFYGNLFASALLLLTVFVVWLYGVKAERSSLEEIASPLSAAGDADQD
jgi:hypothetical protein